MLLQVKIANQRANASTFFAISARWNVRCLMTNMACFCCAAAAVFLFSFHFSCQVAAGEDVASDVHSFCFTAAMHTDLQISAAGAKKNPF